MSASVLLFDAPMSGAYWGWKMTVPDDAGFTCQEGAEIGCESMPPACGTVGGCCAENYTCTVVPDSGSCGGVTEITMMCKDCADDAEIALIGGVCINVGGAGHPVSSYLEWSQVPTCSRRLEGHEGPKAQCHDDHDDLHGTTDDPDHDDHGGHNHDHDDHDGTTTGDTVSVATTMAQDCLMLSAAVVAIGAVA